MDEKLRIEALPLAFLLGALETGLDEIVLALVEDFFADLLPIGEVLPVYLIPHEGDSEIGDDGDSCEPDGESDEAEDHSVRRGQCRDSGSRAWQSRPLRTRSCHR